MSINSRWQTAEDTRYLQVFSEQPVSFDTISEGMNPSMNGTMRDAISQDGVAFWADHEPQMNAIISIGLGGHMMANCTEVEHNALEVDGRLVGKVSSIERNDLTSEIIVKMVFVKRNNRYVPESRRPFVVSHS